MRLVVPTWKGRKRPENPTAEREIAHLRHVEAEHDRRVRLEQELSKRLAHLYGRDVFCALGLEPGTFQVEFADGRVAAYRGVLERATIVGAKFVRLKMAEDMARFLLAREGRMVA
jgi:hypothetical protein